MTAIPREVFTRLAVAAGRINAGECDETPNGASDAIAKAISDLPGYKEDKFFRHAEVEEKMIRARKDGLKKYFAVIITDHTGATPGSFNEDIEVHQSMASATSAALDMMAAERLSGVEITIASWMSAAPDGELAADEFVSLLTNQLAFYTELLVWSHDG